MQAFVSAPLVTAPVTRARSTCAAARRRPPRAAAHSHAPRVDAHNIVMESAERFRAVACATMDFLNAEMQHHLANYALKFGSHIEDLAIIQDISVSGLDTKGLSLEIVTCDDGECVCIHEELQWDGDELKSPDDIPNALRRMSAACGLDDSII